MAKITCGLLAAICLIALASCDPAPKTPKDWDATTTMDLKYFFDDKSQVNYMTSSFSFTYNKESKDMKTQSVDLVLDLTFNQIIAGNKAAKDPKDNMSWGLDCSSADSKCTNTSPADS